MRILLITQLNIVHVLLLTEDSQNSEFVEKEVERAVTYKKIIIPIMLGNIELNSGFRF